MSNIEKINELKNKLGKLEDWIVLDNNDEIYYFPVDESIMIYKDTEHAGFYLNDRKISDEVAVSYYDEVIEKLS